MSDRLTKVSIDSVLYDLGSRGINSYETLADMVAEEISNLYEGCIAYCVEDEKYYQWKSTNEVIATYARWRELVLGGKSQVKEMPVPTAELDGDVVQFIGETNTTYKKGWFYTCVFANEGYVQTSCTADTRGDYYLKGDDGNYTLVQLDGTNFDSSATYYQKVNAVSRWDEISTQSTDNKVDKIDGKGLSTNDLTDELKENYDNASDKAHSHENKTVLDTITKQNVTDWKDASEKAHSHENKKVLDKITQDNLDNWSDASTKAHEHTNKETLDKLNMSADGNLAVENESDVSLELLYGKSLTKERYEQMITNGTIQDDMVYVVDEEDTVADSLINDTKIDTQSTWSSQKISTIKNYTTIPLVSFTGSNNLSSSVNVFWDDSNAFKQLITGVTVTRWRYIFTGTSVGSGTLTIGNATIPIVNDQVGIGASYPHASNWITEHCKALVVIGTNLNFYPKELSIQIEYTM